MILIGTFRHGGVLYDLYGQGANGEWEAVVSIYNSPNSTSDGDVNNCQIYLKADAEEYANDRHIKNILNQTLRKNLSKERHTKVCLRKNQWKRLAINLSNSRKKPVGPKGILIKKIERIRLKKFEITLFGVKSYKAPAGAQLRHRPLKRF